jgi:repressor LexA
MWKSFLTGEHPFTYNTDMEINMYEERLRKIRNFYRAHRRMPSFREIAEMMHYASTNAVNRLVNKLIEEGYVSKDASGRLIPGAKFESVRILGLVEAGFPSPAEEELADTMSLDEYLVDNKEATYMLKVNGESMIDAGIMPGDMVLVERGSNARDGAIVIAEVDGGWTMKYFRKTSNRIWLEPANAKFKPIIPEADLRIAAIVKAVIRKY